MADNWKKKESFSSALVQIVVAAVILAAGVFFYIQRGKARKEVADELQEARALAQRDNPADLKKALQKAEAILADHKSGDVQAFAADTETELWLTHQVPGAEAKAREYLAQAEASNSRSQDRYGSKVQQMAASGKDAEAIQFAEDLRKQGASGAKLWIGIAEAYEGLGNLDLAKEAYKQASDKAWKTPRYYAAWAESLISQGDIDLAIETANKGLQDNPDHYRARLDLALARAKKKDHVKEAADSVKDALSHPDELTPGLQVRALAALAEVAIFGERYDDAIDAAQKALAIDGNSYLALWEKARAQALKKDKGALGTFKAAAAAHKTAPAIYYEGALLLTAAGNTAGGLELLSAYETAFRPVTLQTADGKSIAWLDRDDRYWIARGDVLRSASKLDEALAAYDKGIAVGGMNLAKAHYAKGTVFLAKKDYDKAIDELKLVTPEDGTGHLPEAYLAMGETLFAKKDYPTGCQNYAFALARLKNLQTPRERLNGILEDVNKRLVAAGQGSVAKLWMKEAKPIIQ